MSIQNRTETQASAGKNNSARDGRGRFPPGVSGNSRGRPPITPEKKEVQVLAAIERPANVARLVHLRDNATDQWLQLEAARVLLQYSDGKPALANAGGNGTSVTVNVGGDLAGMSQGDVYKTLASNPDMDAESQEHLINYLRHGTRSQTPAPRSHVIDVEPSPVSPSADSTEISTSHRASSAVLEPITDYRVEALDTTVALTRAVDRLTTPALAPELAIDASITATKRADFERRKADQQAEIERENEKERRNQRIRAGLMSHGDEL